MTFLSPWTALIAAAVALPALLLLYFLKLRRQALRIPSTLLWKKSFEDLQVNAPFQRLRWSALLALQLLMLLALLAALAEPLWRGGEARSSRVVILIDRSASMSAPVLDELPQEDGRPPRTRLDAARQAAADIINSLGDHRDSPTQAMIIAFGSTAQVVSTFESNRGVLRDALDAIEPTDEEANLEAALQLAGAFAGSRDEASESETADAPPAVVLLSDGNVAGTGSGAFSLRAGEFQFVQVSRDSSAPSPPATDSTAVDNLGFAAVGARRDYDDPARVIVFARLVNASANPIDAIVTLSLDGRAAATIRRNVPAATADAPGEATLSHALDLPGGAVITLAHNHADQLSADDVAAMVLPPPAQPRIAMVYGSSPETDPPTPPGPDPYLHQLLVASEPQRLDVFTIDAWNQIDPAAIDSGSRYDLVVFDRVSNQRLPGIPSLTFGGVPAGLRETVTADGDTGGPILSWDRQHPVLRNLSLDSIMFSGFGAFDLPQSTATPLAFGRDGPIIALVRTRGARHIVAGFAMRKSNWPLHVSSAMFVQNALEFLTLAAGGGAASEGTSAGASGGAGLAYRPGEAVMVRAAPDAHTISVEGPSVKAAVPVEAGAPVTLPPFRRAGLYRAQGAMPPNNIIAVSVLSDVESDIRPRDSITVNARASEAVHADTQQPLPLWPWLLAVALVLAIFEWIIYCRRIA